MLNVIIIHRQLKAKIKLTQIEFPINLLNNGPSTEQLYVNLGGQLLQFTFDL